MQSLRPTIVRTPCVVWPDWPFRATPAQSAGVWLGTGVTSPSESPLGLTVPTTPHPTHTQWHIRTSSGRASLAASVVFAHASAHNMIFESLFRLQTSGSTRRWEIVKTGTDRQAEPGDIRWRWTTRCRPPSCAPSATTSCVTRTSAGVLPWMACPSRIAALPNIQVPP